MGTWGYDILDDDFARDVYDEYIDASRRDGSPESILDELRDKWSDAVSDDDEEPVFWLAVAQAQLECTQLWDDVRRRVEDIVARGLGLNRWIEAGPNELAQRKAALSTFLEKTR